MRLLARAFWVPALLALGLVPSIVFGLWAEELGRDPGYGMLYTWALGGPLVIIGGTSRAARAAFDVGLMLAFGAVHTGLAQIGAQELLARVVGEARVRATYVIATGLALWGLMAAWQPLGGALWTLVPGSPVAERAGQLAYFALILTAGRIIAGPGALEFIGLAQVWRGTAGARTAGNPELVESGLYAIVRHPGYALVLVALACANTMTADRMAVLAGCVVYLAIGIPLEERKLAALFGEAYQDYRRRVPALVPRITSRPLR